MAEENCNHNCEECEKANCGERDFKIKAGELTHIKKMYAVMSGKGGVGKTMVTSLLAVALNRLGYRVGILDADITGPSVPKSFGLKNKAEGSQFGILPVKSNGGIEVMSINLLLDDDTDPVVWRGPIISGTVQQFYTDVIWSNLDVMLIDMPPGTGDVPLTIFQSLPIDGIVVVTSPQELVSMIVAKAVKMAEMMKKPLIGIVENLSYFHCPDNGKDYHIFGESHLDEVAKKYNIETISRIAIDPKLSALQDDGEIEKAETTSVNEIVDVIKSAIGDPESK